MAGRADHQQIDRSGVSDTVQLATHRRVHVRELRMRTGVSELLCERGRVPPARPAIVAH
jgi:hypothetical protein